MIPIRQKVNFAPCDGFSQITSQMSKFLLHYVRCETAEIECGRECKFAYLEACVARGGPHVIWLVQ